jgi:hypothetical protein
MNKELRKNAFSKIFVNIASYYCKPVALKG